MTLQDSRLFWTVVLIFAKCTNAKMMDFIKSRLEILFDDGKPREWLSNAIFLRHYRINRRLCPVIQYMCCKACAHSAFSVSLSALYASINSENAVVVGMATLNSEIAFRTIANVEKS